MVKDEPPEQTEDAIELPSVDELKEETAEVEDDALQASFEDDFWRHSTDQEMNYVRLRALQDHYKHKGRWSNFLMFVMFLMVAFQSVLLGLVGGKVWDFTDYEWLLPVLLAQNLAQIVGLAVFVVKALFKDMK